MDSKGIFKKTASPREGKITKDQYVSGKVVDVIQVP
jgi:hypothetical protein